MKELSNDWMTEALCLGLYDKFTVPENATAETFLIMEETARDYCDFCPVIQECLDSAYPEDFKHGIRGGIAPSDPYLELRKYRKRRRTINPGARLLAKGKCAKGHEIKSASDMYISKGYGACRACKQISTKNARKPKKPATIEA